MIFFFFFLVKNMQYAQKYNDKSEENGMNKKKENTNKYTNVKYKTR